MSHDFFVTYVPGRSKKVRLSDLILQLRFSVNETFASVVMLTGWWFRTNGLYLHCFVAEIAAWYSNGWPLRTLTPTTLPVDR